MSTTTKKHLIEALSQQLGITQDLARQCVDVFYQALGTGITSGDRVEIRGFGVWITKETKPRPRARNPRTGQGLSVPARRKVLFKAGKVLRQSLIQQCGDG